MRRFVLKTLLLLLLLKGCDLVLYRVLDALDDPETRQDNLGLLYGGEVNAEICFFGSSRTYCHFHPGVIEEETGASAWNLGTSLAEIDETTFLVEEYLLHNRAPRIIVVEAEPRSLDAGRVFPRDRYRRFAFASDHTRALYSERWLETAALEACTCDAFRGETVRILGRRIAPPPPDPRVVRIQGATLPVESPPPPRGVGGRPVRIAESRKEDFRRLVELSQEGDWILVLVSPPVFEHRRRLDRSVAAESSRFFQGLADAHPDVYYLSYLRDPLLTQDRQYWTQDGVHMNLAGARIFSRRVAADLRPLLKAP